MKTIAVLGTLDTKGKEHEYLAQCIRQLGCRALLIDIGTGLPPTVCPDIDRDTVIQTAGNSLAGTSAILSNDRGSATSVMAQAIPILIEQLAQRREIDGVIAMGGSGGTAIASAAMRALPLGFPKVMISTMAGGNVSRYVDVSDIIMIPSIVDVSGLNRILCSVIERSASVISALVDRTELSKAATQAKPLIVASMFGNTTKCVEQARQLFEEAGYEILVFHATGQGGRTMEAIIGSGQVAGVFDVTTTEWADQLVGGIMPGGPNRLEAAANARIPAVVAPGCLDMVNFGEPASIPNKFAGRKFYQHNPQVTLMRTTPEECRELGRILATKLNTYTSRVCCVFPTRGISIISQPDGPFYDPKADEQLLLGIQEKLRADIPLDLLDCDINSQEFSAHCAKRLLEYLQV